MKSGPLCILACQWCNLPAFWEWSGVANAEGAQRFILRKCGVDSRKRLDHNITAGRLFQRDIRTPFMAWQAAKVPA